METREPLAGSDLGYIRFQASESVSDRKVIYTPAPTCGHRKKSNPVTNSVLMRRNKPGGSRLASEPASRGSEGLMVEGGFISHRRVRWTP